MTFEPSGNRISDSTDCTAVIRLRCVSCTPFGGPVVPDV